MRTQALVIKRQPTNEYDLLVTLYTQELGKLTAIAKSALKPSSTQGPHLDSYNLIDVELVDGKSWPIMAGAQSLDTHRHIKSSLQSMAMAGFFTEAIQKIVFDGQRDDELWDFLNNVFDTLNGDGGCDDATFAGFQRELITVLGHGAQKENLQATLDRLANTRLASGSLLRRVRVVLQ